MISGRGRFLMETAPPAQETPVSRPFKLALCQMKLTRSLAYMGADVVLSPCAWDKIENDECGAWPCAS